MQHTNRFLLFVASLIPGAGHMYLGLMKRGLHLMVLFFCLFSFSVSFDLFFFTSLIGVAAVVVWFYSFFDCHHLHHRIAAGESVPDEGFLTTFGVALLLIGTGGFALIGNIFSFLNRFLIGGVLRTLSNLFFPLLLIALGLLILYQTKRRSDGQEPLHFDRFFKKSDGADPDSEPYDTAQP